MVVPTGRGCAYRSWLCLQVVVVPTVTGTGMVTVPDMVTVVVTVMDIETG